METSNDLLLLPSASNLIESIRSIGYTFETAMADIIDNSLSANSQNINIFLLSFEGSPMIQIFDDGFGMNHDQLINAMRLGSKNPTETRAKDDLGRFGMGLKSASFSQCRLLTVLSKQGEHLEALQWDLDYVLQTQEFNVKLLSMEQIHQIPNVSTLLDKNSGTLVMWQVFDRIKHSSVNQQTELEEQMGLASEHISLVYHRLLGNRLKISINGQAISPKDPFLRSHPGTQELQEKKIVVDGEELYLSPVVIPHYSNLSPNDKRQVGKTNEHYKSQGFYIYRNKRLIVWGDYLGLNSKSELAKNLRIQVDLPNSLDYLWELDIMKSRATVPSKIRKNLLSAITDGENVSRKVNTHKGRQELTKDDTFWKLLDTREGTFFIEMNSENGLIKQFENDLSKEQSLIFTTITKGLENNLPVQALYSRVANGSVQSFEQENLMKELEEFIEDSNLLGIGNQRSLLMGLKKMEPYMSNDEAQKRLSLELEKIHENN
ncbi:ATP-binding protein [Erysipelothrix sp. HDW6C]|uniref:ATP-binding protein n=1 Tax=Erysipelothrix sp. HDW6C TaxID=2714930 RepID=UPI00140ADE4B|nr:ATP-binding protein [Erysipelothrix sp. HDW6C]QIK70271.1 ATP-binding protein [Erysipelothrix sp. HDW6C]